MHTTTKAAAADILRRTIHGRIDALDERRILVNIPPRTCETAHAHSVDRIARKLRDKGWAVEVTAAGVEAVQPTTVEVPFLSSALIRAARAAAALDQRIGIFDALTIKVGLYGDGWSLDDNSDALLHYAGGNALIASPFRPIAPGLPARIAEAAERRFAAGMELRRLLAELPFTGEALTIPLHAVA
ncbi:hypothetical protein ACFVJK_30320 [Streptomyces sp. NPDC127172]|uniref:hypothetical protein n=1 Tax=Streptomyces sp. NPDC127172 TaxID=3345382 RepID=UPI003645ADBE